MMKKAVSAILLLAVCIILFLFSRTKTIVNLMSTNPENIREDKAELREESDREELSDRPLKEGCYIGGEYVLQIVFTGSEAENTYNTMLFRKDTGACVFSGAAFDIEPDAKTVSVLSGNIDSMVLTVNKPDGGEETLTAAVSYKGEQITYMCGSYRYSGNDWTSDTDVNSEYLLPGDYHSENGVFLLSIRENNSVMSFDISDTFKQSTVFRGQIPLSAGQYISTATLYNSMVDNTAPEEKKGSEQNGVQMVEFDKSLSGGMQYVDVTDHSANGAAEYAGRYIYEGREFLDAGEYTKGDLTVKITRSTVKYKNTAQCEYKYSECITLSDGDGSVLFKGTEEFAQNEYAGVLTFEDGDKTVSFYKGVGEDSEYVEMLNFGYVEGTAVCERYELTGANSR